MRRHGWISVIIACLATTEMEAAPREEVLFDFSTTGIARHWAKPQGNLALEWEEPPVAAEPALGTALKFTAGKGGFLHTAPGQLPDDLAACAALTFWVYRPEPTHQPDTPAVIEIQFLEQDGRAKFWRRVDLDQPGWRPYVVPLRFMVMSATRTPRWDQVRHLGIYFRTPATIWVDQVALQRDATNNAQVSVADLAAIGFPRAAPDALRIRDTPHLLIMTDAPELDLERLAQRLNQVVRDIRADLSFTGALPSRPILLVFATRDSYRQYSPRFAARLNATAAPPTSDGYTLQGIATSYWDPSRGTDRPVYVHEFVHALVERLTGVPSGSGNWLQEGLANHYQIRCYPQDSLAAIVREGLARKTHRWPLDQLCSGKRIPSNRYWQALTVVRLLVTEPKYQAKLGDLFDAIRASGSTDLGPLLGPLYQTDWDGLTADWMDFCQKTYPAP